MERFQRLVAPNQGLKRWNSSDSYQIPSLLTYWPVQKTDESGKMMMDYCKLNNALIPIAATVPDMVLLLDQIINPLASEDSCWSGK